MKHGHAMRGSKTSTYEAWKSMRKRCGVSSKRTTSAGLVKVRKSYADRGITVCDRWSDSFVNFLEDMGEKPLGLTLDRIDNNKGYSKDNCRWATYKTQSENRRVTKWVTIKGRRMTCSGWARYLGIRRAAISNRVRAGYSRSHFDSVMFFYRKQHGGTKR